MNEILMPRLGVNDDTVILGQWIVPDKSVVKKGQTIAIIETSKETSELKSDFDGHIIFSVKVGEDVPVGAVVATITDEETIDDNNNSEQNEVADTRTYTNKARALLEEHPEIDVSKLPSEGIIKESDILKQIKKPYHIEDTMSNHILIYGRGGLCKDIIDIVRQTNAYQIDGIIDFYYPEVSELYGIPVLGGVKELKDIYEKGYHKIISAVAFWGDTYTKHYRRNPAIRLKQLGFEFVNVIDRSSSIANNVKMGEGNLICANVYVGPDAQIGSDVILNAGCIVNHDCIVSDHCHIASGAILAGEVIVGENTLIGQGAIIHAGVKIGSNVTINNGCTVFKDVREGTIVTK